MTRSTPQLDSSDLKSAIRTQARDIGFDVVRFARGDIGGNDQAVLAKFIAAGYHGDMDWLARDDGRRGDPVALLPSVKSIIVLGVNYGPGEDPLALLQAKSRGAISVYARGGDYHTMIKKRLKRLGRWIADTHRADIRVYVDTAPVMEKPLAARAGVGWQGKHTNLISREFGSWLFLGEVFTDLDLPPDAPEVDHCGSCDACMRACPTDAFPEPYKLDARKCISYLTIEHKSDIDDDLMDAMGNRIYGCDDCLAVCPWTKFTQTNAEPAFVPRMELTAPRLADLARLDDATFRDVFKGSPIKRTGRDRFVRNVLIAIGNSGDPSLLPRAAALLDDDSPLVARAAARAVEKLSEVVNGHEPVA